MQDRLILHAINEAYRNIRPHSSLSGTLLFLDMPYDEVDVNVHPAKVEVRFRHSNFVHDFARDAIRQALMSVRPVPSFAAAAGANGEANRTGLKTGHLQRCRNGEPKTRAKPGTYTGPQAECRERLFRRWKKSVWV